MLLHTTIYIFFISSSKMPAFFPHTHTTDVFAKRPFKNSLHIRTQWRKCTWHIWIDRKKDNNAEPYIYKYHDLLVEVYYFYATVKRLHSAPYHASQSGERGGGNLKMAQNQHEYPQFGCNSQQRSLFWEKSSLRWKYVCHAFHSAYATSLVNCLEKAHR